MGAPGSEQNRELTQAIAQAAEQTQGISVLPMPQVAALSERFALTRRRTEIAAYLLDREAWDCFAVHYGESDTVAHHF